MNLDLPVASATLSAIMLIIFLGYLKKKGVDFGIRTLIAMVLGIILGIAFKDKMQYVQVIGRIYVGLISSFVVPLLFFSIISSITALDNIQRLKTIGLKSIAWLTSNTFIASIITVVLALTFGIGRGSEVSMPTDYTAREVPEFTKVIIDLFPSNIFAQAAANNIIPIIIFSMILGIAVVALSDEDQDGVQMFKSFIESGLKVINKGVLYVIELTPYAVLAFIANAVSKNGPENLLPLLSIFLIAYLICFIQAFIVNGALVAFVAKLNPITFFKHIWPAQMVAFTSQSSLGSVPVTIKSLHNAGVSDSIASFVAPLGANVGMPACAGMWPTLLAVFAINALGLDFTTQQYILLVLVSTMVSIGTVGVPGTATITTTAVFAAVGLPIEIIVLMTPISAIVDMARTATNVTAAATSALLVAKSENEIDLVKYNNKGKATLAEV